MNREEITRMAREAGFTNPEKFTTTDENLQGILSDFWENLERFAALVAAVEREECAKACEDEIKRVKPIYSVTAENALKAIRARGQA